MRNIGERHSQNPARWRTGIGRRLVAALIDRLDPQRWTHLVLWTVRDASPTNAFYVSLGMVREGREVLLDRGGPVPLVRFSAQLEKMRAKTPRQCQNDGSANLPTADADLVLTRRTFHERPLSAS